MNSKFFVFIVSISLIALVPFFVSAKPNAPAWVNASPSPSNNAVEISWQSVSGADSYMIFRTTDSPSMSSSPSWQSAGSTSSNNYYDSGVSPDTDYWYKVVAVDNHDPIDQFSDDAISSRVHVPATPSIPPPGPAPSGGTSTSGLLPIVQCGGEGQSACTLCDIFETISRLINIILIFSFVIGGGLLAVGGIMMYFGGSSYGLLNKAKALVKGVIIGIIVMLVSYLIVFTIIHVLSGGNADTYFNIKNGGFLIECES